MTLQEAINRFYRRCVAMNMSENTITNYRYQFKALADYFSTQGIMLMENVTSDDVRGYLAHMRAKGYAPDTIKDRYVGLATLFNFLCEDGLLMSNPVKTVKRPKLPKIPARTFTATEIQKILAFYNEGSFTFLRNKLIMYILFGTGIRKSELLGLTVFSLHLDEQYMTIIGKGNKQRQVPLSPQLTKLLRKYLDRRAEVLLHNAIETSVLLISKYGKPLTDGGLQEVFRKMKDKTNITGRRFSPHTFRHSFAKNFLLNGGNLFALQEILGHEDVSTTRVYVEYTQQEIAEQMKNFSPLENSRWSYLA